MAQAVIFVLDGNQDDEAIKNDLQEILIEKVLANSKLDDGKQEKTPVSVIVNKKDLKEQDLARVAGFIGLKPSMTAEDAISMDEHFRRSINFYATSIKDPDSVKNAFQNIATTIENNLQSKNKTNQHRLARTKKLGF